MVGICSSRYVPRYQIFQLNALSWSDFPEKEAEAILAQLIADSEVTHGYQSAKEEHPSIAALTKYFYKFAEAQRVTEVDERVHSSSLKGEGGATAVEKDRCAC